MAGGNRLGGESSPYLRQHADNPVDWFPWGDEAFAEARRRDVPVLLSVGYSACHWCQVSLKRRQRSQTPASCGFVRRSWLPFAASMPGSRSRV